MYNQCMDYSAFTAWFNKKYVEFRGDSRLTVTDFAKELDIPQPTVSVYLLGKGPPRDRKNLTKIAKKYPEVYEVLGMQGPINQKETKLVGIEKLPQDVQSRLLAAIAEINAEFERRNLTGEMPEAKQITFQIMAAHGFKDMATTAEEPSSRNK